MLCDRAERYFSTQLFAEKTLPVASHPNPITTGK
jgi:hypothetical protein